MSTITKDEVEHIARLARIRLTEEQKEKMTKELGAILTYVEKLKEVDTTGVEPTAQVTGLESVFRKDDGEGRIKADFIKGYLKVKAVFNDDA